MKISSLFNRGGKKDPLSGVKLMTTRNLQIPHVSGWSHARFEARRQKDGSWRIACVTNIAPHRSTCRGLDKMHAALWQARADYSGKKHPPLTCSTEAALEILRRLEESFLPSDTPGDLRHHWQAVQKPARKNNKRLAPQV